MSTRRYAIADIPRPPSDDEEVGELHDDQGSSKMPNPTKRPKASLKQRDQAIAASSRLRYPSIPADTQLPMNWEGVNEDIRLVMRNAFIISTSPGTEIISGKDSEWNEVICARLPPCLRCKVPASCVVSPNCIDCGSCMLGSGHDACSIRVLTRYRQFHREAKLPVVVAKKLVDRFGPTGYLGRRFKGVNEELWGKYVDVLASSVELGLARSSPPANNVHRALEHPRFGRSTTQPFLGKSIISHRTMDAIPRGTRFPSSGPVYLIKRSLRRPRSESDGVGKANKVRVVDPALCSDGEDDHEGKASSHATPRAIPLFISPPPSGSASEDNHISDMQLEGTCSVKEVLSPHAQPPRLQSQANRLNSPEQYIRTGQLSVHLDLPTSFTRPDPNCSNWEAAYRDLLTEHKRLSQQQESGRGIIEKMETESTEARSKLDDANTRLDAEQVINRELRARLRNTLDVSASQANLANLQESQLARQSTELERLREKIRSYGELLPQFLKFQQLFGDRDGIKEYTSLQDQYREAQHRADSVSKDLEQVNRLLSNREEDLGCRGKELDSMRIDLEKTQETRDKAFRHVENLEKRLEIIRQQVEL